MKNRALPVLAAVLLAPIALSAAQPAKDSAGPLPEDGPPRAQGPAEARPGAAGAGTGRPAAGKAQPGAAAAKAEPAAGPAPAPVGAADAKSATEAALAYLDALRLGGFGAAPGHLHPQALERFKSLAMPAFEAERARGTRGLLNATFGRTASFAEVRAADPADFMARFARVIAARQADAAPRFSTATAIGVLREGEVLHVLVRLGGGDGSGDTTERLAAVTLMPDRLAWKVLLDDRLESVARSLAGRQAQGERRPGQPLIEPLPEGVPLAPLPELGAGPQGPAGLPPPPGAGAPSR